MLGRNQEDFIEGDEIASQQLRSRIRKSMTNSSGWVRGQKKGHPTQVFEYLEIF